MNTQCTIPSPQAAVQLQKPLYTVNGSAEAYDVRVVMPGVAKSGVKIDLEDNVLTIHGSRTVSAPDNWKPLHQEISALDYQLRLQLNIPVDPDKLTASQEHGVLHVRLPVKEAAKPRRIEIQ